MVVPKPDLELEPVFPHQAMRAALSNVASRISLNTSS
jgi:hypothetical protein